MDFQPARRYTLLKIHLPKNYIESYLLWTLIMPIIDDWMLV
jgi:hypothetical protein